MKELNCKLILSDFDGTLANSGNVVPAEVIAAINNYVNDGGIFAVCTGRILPSIMPRVRQLGLKGLVVACQGSVIADIESGELVRNVSLTNEQAAEICAAVEGVCDNVQTYTNEGFYSSLPADNEHLAQYESIIGVDAGHPQDKMSQFVLHSGKRFNKVALLCHPREQAGLYASLKAKFGGKYDVTCSAKVLIEISPYGETKGEALKYLAARYGVPVEKTCAVGDNLNDLSMLLAAGYGVAVGNCAETLKSKVKYITVTNDEGAVARVIERYGYKNDD